MFSKRIQQIAPSATLAMSQLAAEMKQQGIDVINLSLGEPDFSTPKHICEAAKQAIDDGFTHYTTVDGLLSLREAITDKLLKENGLHYTPDQIIVGTGGKQGIFNVIQVLVDEGDEVILPAPYWLSYPEMVKFAGGKNVVIKTTLENNYKLTAEQLENAITDRTKLLILCSPSNPTGSVYSKLELQALAEVLRRHPEVYVLSDEIYEHISYCGKTYSIALENDLNDRVIIANGVSKAYAMTGWRIGWIAANKEIIKACKKLQGQTTSNASAVAQKAAEAAYRGTQEPVEQMRQAFLKRRDLVVRLASELPNVKFNNPDGAFYLMLDVSFYIGRQLGGKTMSSSADIVRYLLEKAHVTCVDGAAFGAEGTLRISFATSENNLIEAFNRIKNALS
ncbi:MAG: pyridoxal phosphate-dependent aminotransferase [Paludibacteraceae bacterium]|nr:pyridoxal phosphate-dependent aminotransferase [Paludibacteraceae bacterium]